jgi:hypothetical protein
MTAPTRRMSVAQIKELKKIYAEKVKTYYRFVRDPIVKQKETEKSKIKDEFYTKLHKTLADAGFEPRDITYIKNNEYNLKYIVNFDDFESKYNQNQIIVNCREQEKVLCKAEKQKYVELEQWFMDSLVAPSRDEMPTFNVDVIPNPMECTTD